MNARLDKALHAVLADLDERIRTWHAPKDEALRAELLEAYELARAEERQAASDGLWEAVAERTAVEHFAEEEK